MRSPRVVLVLVLLLSVSLAGCSFRDWYDQKGTARLVVQFHADDPPEDMKQANPEADLSSRLEDFQKLQIIVRSSQLRQLDAANPATSTSRESEILDAVQLAEAGTRVTLIEEKVSMRGFQEAQIKIEVVDGTTASGERLVGCMQGQPVETHPCISFASSYPRGINPADFSVPRGGTLDVVFPFYVGFGGQDYFVFSGAPVAERD